MKTKNMMDKKAKLKLPIKTYLLILVLVACMITGMSYAKFTTTVSGVDSISLANYVIQYDLSKGATPVTLTMDEMKPGDTKQYNIRVSNYKDAVRSDLALNFYLEIDTDTILPLDIELEENKPEGNIFYLDRTTHKVISDSYNLLISSSTYIDFILTISWPGNLNDKIYRSLTDTITVQVVWEQIT